MSLIGMGEAGRRLGIRPNSARRALQNAGVPLVVISRRAFAVDERDLDKFIRERGALRPGRPRKKVSAE